MFYVDHDARRHRVVLGFMRLQVVPGMEHVVSIGVGTEENAYNIYKDHTTTCTQMNSYYFT